MASPISAANQLKSDTSMEKEDDTNVDPELLERLLEQLGFKDKDELLESMDTHAEDVIRAQEAAEKRTEDPLKNWVRPHNEECPICLLPLPVYENGVMYRQCCDSLICKGCVSHHMFTLIKEGVEKEKGLNAVMACPLCRQVPKENVDMFALQKDLANAGKLEAMYELAMTYIHGENGVMIDWDEGLKWIKQAAAEGFGKASYFIGQCYWDGRNTIERDMDKAIKYFKQAGDDGFVYAFATAADALYQEGEIEESMLNYRKAAMCGVNDEDLFTQLREGFGEGYITKEEYAYTLREYQKVSNEMKSASRTFALKHEM